MRANIWWERAEKRGAEVSACTCCAGPAPLDEDYCVHCQKRIEALA